MAAGLGPDELGIVDGLVKAGRSLEEASAAVVMAVRQHSRPEHELIDILRSYSGLEDPVRNQAAVAKLRLDGWLQDYDSYGLTLVRQAPDLRIKIAAALNNPGVAAKLAELQSLRASYVTVIGSMNDIQAYDGFHSRIRSAASSILLPMLATSPKLHAAELLRERSRNGVKVRILLATPAVTAKIRGAGSEKQSVDAIAGWKEHAENHPNIEIRLTDSVDHCLAASSMMVDNKILRFDVYDARKQRSLQGEMFEICSPQELDLNINTMYRMYFEKAWKEARPLGFFRAARWYLKKARFYLICIPFFLAALCAGATPLGGILGSVAASFFVADIIVRLD